MALLVCVFSKAGAKICLFFYNIFMRSRLGVWLYFSLTEARLGCFGEFQLLGVQSWRVVVYSGLLVWAVRRSVVTQKISRIFSKYPSPCR